MKKNHIITKMENFNEPIKINLIKFEKFNILNIFKSKKSFNSIIKDNIDKIKEENGLRIKKDDIDIEIKILNDIFKEYDFHQNKSFNDIYKDLLDRASEMLKKQVDYYFFQHPDNKKNKTKYYKHLEQTISDLLRFKINEKI